MASSTMKGRSLRPRQLNRWWILRNMLTAGLQAWRSRALSPIDLNKAVCLNLEG